MRHRKFSVVPFFAVIFRLTDAPFLASMKAESPARSTFGPVVEPTPFSRNRNFGGASLFGSAPWACPSWLQIRQFRMPLGVFGRSDFLSTVKVCGPSPGALLTTLSVPPDL